MIRTLLDIWREAAADLLLDVDGPLVICFPNNSSVSVDVLVKNFGGIEGTIVITDYDKIGSHIHSIMEAGYGFSVMGEPSENACYDRDTFISMLAEWEWSGSAGQRPPWLS